MGCDIHLYIEWSRDGGKTWEADQGHHAHKGEASGGYRNYNMFSAMACVRGYHSDGFAPRGMPDAPSEFVLTEWKSWERDAHTPSWLTLSEYLTCLRKCGLTGINRWPPVAFYRWQDYGVGNTEPGYIGLGAYCKKQLAQLKAEHKLLGDPYTPLCRLVFWFDS